jgi:uncharacterized protein
MASLLVHVTTGPDNPTKAALAFLVAKTAVDAGHRVTLFLAGDGAGLIRDGVLDNLAGLGTGRLRESYDAITAKGARIFVSTMSSKARGITEADLQGKPAEFAAPDRLVTLILESDKTVVY